MEKNIIISNVQDKILLTKIVDESEVETLTAFHESEFNAKTRLISEDELPQHFTLFYDAFRLSAGFENENVDVTHYFYVDYSVAKEIWYNKFREARESILQLLDVEYMRAIETGNTVLQQEVVVKKQALRDVTLIELPDNLEAIMSIWPEILGQAPSFI